MSEYRGGYKVIRASAGDKIMIGGNIVEINVSHEGGQLKLVVSAPKAITIRHEKPHTAQPRKLSTRKS